jgi:hypothetical protein
MSTMSPKIFLSYSHHDKAVARRVARQLRAHGVGVWMDETELRLGTALTNALSAHIEESDVVVVVASKAFGKQRRQLLAEKGEEIG